MLEMCVAIVMLGLMAQAVVQFWTVFTRQTVALEAKGYASMKAKQMLNELMAQANGHPLDGGAILDGYNDGLQYNLILTTDKQVQNPGDPLSGNRQANGHWEYLRQIEIYPSINNPDTQARQVIINVWKCDSDGSPLVPGVLLASQFEMVIPGVTQSDP